jgi:N-sulfoglucosamine sulfohydrolase
MKTLRFLCLLVAFAYVCTAAETLRRPDIVIFLTDDHSQLDSTPFGSRELRTPNMQRLAGAGLTFTRAFVASPSCAPSQTTARHAQ